MIEWRALPYVGIGIITGVLLAQQPGVPTCPEPEPCHVGFATMEDMIMLLSQLETCESGNTP